MTYDTNTQDWATIAEELGRKGLGALKKWVDRYQAGKITARELFIVSDALFDTMSGLAPWEDTDIVAAINDDLRQQARKK